MSAKFTPVAKVARDDKERVGHQKILGEQFTVHLIGRGRRVADHYGHDFELVSFAKHKSVD